MNTNGAVLRLEEVTRRYRSALNPKGFALSPTSVEILPGTWTVFSGRSGAGKTTLLQLLSALDRPDSGRVWMFGRDITEDSESALAEIRRKRLGIVYQQFHFIEHLPIWQNVSCRLVPAGVTGAVRRRRAEQIMGQLQLPDSVDRLPCSLSGGEQQRVALARAVIDQPDVLIADEPTSNVDSETGDMIVTYLKNLQRNGTTIVVSTHDQALMAAADHHHVMEEGRLIS